MKTEIASGLLIRLVLRPSAVFEELSETQPVSHVIFFRYLIWLAIIPPLFAFIGASNFGWRLGAAEPLYIPTGSLILISMGYFFLLLFGLVALRRRGRASRGLQCRAKAQRRKG